MRHGRSRSASTTSFWRGEGRPQEYEPQTTASMSAPTVRPHPANRRLVQAPGLVWERQAFKLLQRWFGRSAKAAAAEHGQSPDPEREVQALRLELQERDREIAVLKADAERLRRAESGRISTAVRAERERLLADAAGPMAQLLTPTHLLEVDGKTVAARDVLAVARRLVRLLEDEGFLEQSAYRHRRNTGEEILPLFEPQAELLFEIRQCEITVRHGKLCDDP